MILITSLPFFNMQKVMCVLLRGDFSHNAGKSYDSSVPSVLHNGTKMTL